MRVLILEPLESEVIRWLSDRHDVVVAPELVGQPAALAEALAGAQGLIVPPSLAVDARLLKGAPQLRVVGRVSAGAENLHLEACRQAGVEIVRSNMASANAEAEFVVGALLALLRRVPVQSSDGLMVGRELGCSTVGLIGMSASARVLGQLLPVFGTRVLGYDPSLHPTDPVWSHWGVDPVPIKELMEQSDGLCVQLPYFPRYRGLMAGAAEGGHVGPPLRREEGWRVRN